MLISNFNLYKTEWLDLVFAKRNKEYGAFYIRQHYAQNLTKAMAITFVTVFGAAVLIGKLIGVKPAAVVEKVVSVTIDPLIAIPPPPKVEPPKPKVEQPAEAAAPKPSAPTKMNAFPPPIVTSEPVEVDLPRVDDHTAVGPVTVKNGAEGSNAEAGAVDRGGAGAGEGTAAPNGIFISVERMPEPANGMDGWSKFLQNTIRYPGVAIENGISGKVIVSFIIEKDGHLSNIKVERGQGYGLDEEAVRVLKQAKAWKPGMQNGQPVRVKLTLPIAFSLGEQ